MRTHIAFALGLSFTSLLLAAPGSAQAAAPSSVPLPGHAAPARDGEAPDAPAGWTVNEDAELTADDAAADDWFGYSVAVSGDTVVVGTPKKDVAGPDSGAAYVLVNDGTSWSEETRLTPDDGTGGAQFGWSVAISGDTVVVGAHLASEAGVPSGAAYVFVRTGTVWTQEAKLVASDAAAQDYFGYAVAVSGDRALIGAYGDDDNGDRSGSAYVFVRSGTTWTEEDKLTDIIGQANDYFGRSVALDGDMAFIGADGDDGAATGSGAVHVFQRAGSTWGLLQALKASVPGAFDRFGKAVALSGDHAVIAAPTADQNGKDAGLAYVFVLDAGTWTQEAELSPSDPGEGHGFGESVAILDGLVVVGAPANDAAGVGAGAAYVFSLEDAAWTETQRLAPSDAGPDEYFGRSVAAAGTFLLAGAYRRDTAFPDAGSAFAYRLLPGAAATFRNGGANPASYIAVTLPILGDTYTGTVDVGGTTGHSLALLAGFAAPLTLPLTGGQVLLMDITDPLGELLSQAALMGPVATFDIPIPADPSLVGFEVATQALHLGVVQPFALSNAQDLRLGY